MRVLVVDDEPGLRETVALLLRDEGYDVATAAGGEEALRRTSRETFDVLLVDLRMPDIDGLAFLERYRAAGGAGLVVVMTAYGTRETAIEALRRGAYDYLPKPFDADELVLTLRKAEERERLRGELQALQKRLATLTEPVGFHGFVSRSPAMAPVLEVAARVAPYPTTVLLTGESGTGKEVLARAIHAASHRRDGPFVVLNCAAIPETLLESELFGHERGAFTGADRARPGVFGEAEGGTLLLDEIAELPPTLQAKLLRALQERKIRRVGGQGELPVDVRILVATAKDLAAEVHAGRFRNDLWYRISVVHLHLPPLRARPEDIPVLAEHFYARHAARLGIDAVPLPAELWPFLVRYPWPGNARELENTMERLLVLSGGRPTPAHLPAHIREWRATIPTADDGDLSVKRRLPALERELIARALERTGGNRTRAAELLELSVRALSYKIREYGLD